MEPVHDLDKLRFYRDEVKHEFNLLAMRSNLLVVCQSFLVVPFAILSASANLRGVLVPLYLVAFLGTFVAVILLGPLYAAHRTIVKWLLKQRALFKTSGLIRELAIDRDEVAGSDFDIKLDRDHTKSISFSRFGPWAFILFWFGAIVWATLRALALI